MNALALWIPGTALIVAGAVMLAVGQLELGSALVLIIVGAVLETAGILLWIRQRRTPGRPAR
jgi:membrane protein DedA with SNARE-associated domain